MFPRIAILALTFLLCSASARADYGWIPDFQKLQLKVGADFLRTSENFLTDGSQADVLFRGTPARLTDFRFFVEPEYGIAPDWAIKLRMNYVSDSLDPQTGDGGSYLSGSGLGDIWGSIKWQLKSTLPILTFEVAAKVPTYGMVPTTPTDLLQGDGNFDLGFYLHTGHRAGPVVLSLSPGLLARFSGYSSAFTLDGAIEFQFPRGYIRALGSLLASFGNNLLFDSGPNTHDAPGAGDSYARLSGSPVGLYAGGRIGAIIVPGFTLEGGVNQALAGSRYPDFTEVTVNLFITFDFFKPDTRKKIKEVPLNERPEPFYEPDEK